MINFHGILMASDSLRERIATLPARSHVPSVLRFQAADQAEASTFYIAYHWHLMGLVLTADDFVMAEIP